jgi:hypothetical protein
MSLVFVVEGTTDVPVVSKVLDLAGWKQPFTALVQHGKVELDRSLSGFNRAAKGSPWFVLRDLDHDAPCPAALIPRLLPHPAPLMCLRVAVRAIEAWLLADAATLAEFLHVSENLIPGDPEAEEDPKIAMVSLARRSTKPAVQKDMLPERGSSRRIGRGYEGRIIEYGQVHWRPDVARSRSRSLDRALCALERLREDWVHPAPALLP